MTENPNESQEEQAWKGLRVSALKAHIDILRSVQDRLRSLGQDADPEMVNLLSARLDVYVTRLKELTGEDF